MEYSKPTYARKIAKTFDDEWNCNVHLAYIKLCRLQVWSIVQCLTHEKSQAEVSRKKDTWSSSEIAKHENEITWREPLVNQNEDLYKRKSSTDWEYDIKQQKLWSKYFCRICMQLSFNSMYTGYDIYVVRVASYKQNSTQLLLLYMGCRLYQNGTKTPYL